MITPLQPKSSLTQSLKISYNRVINPTPAFKNTALSGVKSAGYFGVAGLITALSELMRAKGWDVAANLSLIYEGAWLYRPYSSAFFTHLTDAFKLLKWRK